MDRNQSAGERVGREYGERAISLTELVMVRDIMPVLDNIAGIIGPELTQAAIDSERERLLEYYSSGFKFRDDGSMYLGPGA